MSLCEGRVEFVDLPCVSMLFGESHLTGLINKAVLSVLVSVDVTKVYKKTLQEDMLLLLNNYCIYYRNYDAEAAIYEKSETTSCAVFVDDSCLFVLYVLCRCYISNHFFANIFLNHKTRKII